MRARAAWVVLALGLAGCGGLNSTLADPVMPVQAALVVAPGAVDAELTRLQQALARRASGRHWQLSRGAGDWLRLRIGADELFEPGSAQLRASALLACADLAAVLETAPAVTHILVHGDGGSAEPWIDLSARRAASLQQVLLDRGFPPTHLRAEGRGARQPLGPDAGAANRRVELVVQPVVAGREAEAWQPPACEGCAPRG